MSGSRARERSEGALQVVDEVGREGAYASLGTQCCSAVPDARVSAAVPT